MIKPKSGQKISRYEKNSLLNDCFMMDSYNEGVKYFAHNKKRYIYVLNEIEHLIKNMPNKISILDIGTSPFTFILRERFKKARIYSVDYTNRFEKLCKLKKIHFKRVDLNKQKISFGKTKFDLVIFLEVLEHLKIDGKQIIGDITDLMVKNGYCILQTPNKYSPKVQTVNILPRIIWDKLSILPQVPIEFVHFKEYSLGELSRIIDEVKIIRIMKKEYSMYFDEMDSALVYRKYIKFSFLLVKVNHLIVKNIPFLRRGIQIVFQKVS